MRYVVLLVDFADQHWNDLDDATQADWMARHGAFAGAVRDREGCVLVGGEALTGGGSATVLRNLEAGPALTDGPYTESTEAIGGLYLVDAPDLDTLVDLLTVLPPYMMEIRPVEDV